MTVDPVAQALHQKSVLGGVLTAEEQERLRQWYTMMDEEEAAMFAKARERENADGLQAQIDEVMAQIIEETQRNQTLELENAKLRAEVELLKEKIAQKMVPQPT